MLSRLGLDFEIKSPDIDETRLPGETPRATAHRLAQQKALTILAQQPQSVVIGADQVLDLNGQALGKPGSHPAAFHQLTLLSGQMATFYSAVAVVCATNRQVAVVACQAVFKRLSPAQIDRYLKIDLPYDTAGSARAESLGIALLDKLASDDPTAIIGLPLIQLTAMLSRIGLNPLNQPVLSHP